MFVIISIVIISIVGTLSHFLYDISNHNKFIGLFCAVNESTWEHIKIALTPTILWSLVDGIKYGSEPNYFLAKFVSLLIIIILMPVLFYGYLLITKKDLFVLDILIFYIVIIASQLAFHYIIKAPPVNNVINYLSCVGVFLIFAGYLIHTALPGKSFLFKDPKANKYGYEGHTEIKRKK